MANQIGSVQSDLLETVEQEAHPIRKVVEILVGAPSSRKAGEGGSDHPVRHRQVFQKRVPARDPAEGGEKADHRPLALLEYADGVTPHFDVALFEFPTHDTGPGAWRLSAAIGWGHQRSSHSDAKSSRSWGMTWEENSSVL